MRTVDTTVTANAVSLTPDADRSKNHLNPGTGADPPSGRSHPHLLSAHLSLAPLPYVLSAIEFAAESDCIATLSERLARRLSARYALQVLAPPLALPPCAGSQVWHPRLDADPAHAWLRRLVANIAASNRELFGPGRRAHHVHRSAPAAARP